jgi:hypothetical protein
MRTCVLSTPEREPELVEVAASIRRHDVPRGFLPDRNLPEAPRASAA